MKLISPEEINKNTFHLIDKDWMLITAGVLTDFNTMTASWGGFGILWNQAVTFIFVRPQRYTYEFLEKYDHFTLSFFDKSHRKMLNYCGKYSGRDKDKVKETGLVPVETPGKNIYFEQADMVLECRKIYYNDILPENFLDPLIIKNYPENDFHRLYIGSIQNCWIKC